MASPHAQLPSAGEVMSYAPPIRSHRKRIRRAAYIVGLCALVGAVLLAGPRLQKNIALLNIQNRCFRATAPSDKIVYEDDNKQGASLILSDRQYVSDLASGSTVWFCDPWNRLYTLLSPPGGKAMATLFIGERHLPGGSSRLIVVEGSGSGTPDAISLQATIIEPGSVLQPPRILCTTFTTVSVRRPARIFSGQPDPSDPSLISIYCDSGTTRCEIGVRLKDNETSVQIDSHYVRIKSPAPSSPATLPTLDRSPAFPASDRGGQ